MKLFDITFLFVSSYFPLFLSMFAIEVISIKYGGTDDICAEICGITIFVVSLIVLIAGCIKYCIQKRKIKNEKDGKKITIIKAKRKKDISISFITSYILPIISFDFAQGKDMILFLIYFVFIYLIVVFNKIVYMNVFVSLLNYNYYYECEVEGKSRMNIIISKAQLDNKNEHEMYIYEINDNIGIAYDEERDK